MAATFYWGDGGQYGPYTTQEDGWPNAGEVMREYRERCGLSAEAFALSYSRELKNVGKQNKKGRQGKQGKVTATWILNMEKQNLVPTDMIRRRVIAHLLDIPAILFGLASLEEVVIEPHREIDMSSAGKPALIQKVAMDVTKYQKNVRIALHIHRTSNANTLLCDIHTDIQDLESLETQVKGELLYTIRELLLSNYLLATRIMRDQRKYSSSYVYANKAVRVAKSMEDRELIATATYMRGCAKAEWGRRGIVQNGIFQLDRSKMLGAIKDFQKVLDEATSQQGHIHPQLEGFTRLQMSRALGMLKSSKQDSKVTQALTLSDPVAGAIERENIDDFYTRSLITGTLSGLHMGGYHLGRAEIFNAVGLPGKALAELKEVKKLTQKTYGGDETRYRAWFDVLMAETAIELEEYYEATRRAKNALVIFHTIHSVRNIATVRDIHGRIAASSYGASIDVGELGDMLTEWYGEESPE